MILVVTLVFLVFFQKGYSRRILYISYDHYSHFVPNMEIAKVLKNRGHEIFFHTVGFSYHNRSEKYASKIPNDPKNFHFSENDVHDLDDGTLQELNKMVEAYFVVKKFAEYSDFQANDDMCHIFSIIVDSLIGSARGVIHSLSETESGIDMIIGDGLLDFIIQLAEQKGIEFASTHPFLLPRRELSPPFIPDYVTTVRMSEMTFYERFKKQFIHPFVELYYLGPLRLLKVSRVYEKHGLELDLSYRFLRQKLVITMSMFGFEYPHPRLPNEQLVGPILEKDETSIRPKNENDEALLLWLNDKLKTGKKVIYVCLGSKVVPPKEQFHKFFLEIRGRTILFANSRWSQLVSEIQDKLVDFRGEEWVNQRMILNHEAVEVYVTHGGASSLSEAIYFQKKVLVIPMRVDGLGSYARTGDSGIGLGIASPGSSGAPKEFGEKINALIDGEDGRFEKSLQVLKKLVDFLGGQERAADWIELVMEIGSDWMVMDHVSYFQRTNVDVWGLGIFLMLLFVTSTIWGCYVTVKYIRNAKSKDKND